jgi:hypothetical protein
MIDRRIVGREGTNRDVNGITQQKRGAALSLTISNPIKI